MSNLIHRLKQKPEEQRKQIVMIVVVVLMSLVVLVWLSTLGVKEEKQKKTEEDSGPSPFSMLIESFTETFKGIKESISEVNINEVKEELVENKDNQELEEEQSGIDYIKENLSQ
jgi:flagellar basal body-associated protein FliL